MAHDPALKIFLPGNSNGMIPFADFFTNMETGQSVRPKEIDRENASWPPTRNSTHEINGNG
jgi:hypothetical protein